jgi:hypothetical protein
MRRSIYEDIGLTAIPISRHLFLSIKQEEIYFDRDKIIPCSVDFNISTICVSESGVNILSLVDHRVDAASHEFAKWSSSSTPPDWQIS